MDRAIQAPVITCSRLRMQTDGTGITTLVCFHGCPLRCKWCINAFSFAPETKRAWMTPAQLYDKVRIDQLYFLATGGGVTFGGGEPLLQADFLAEFRRICGRHWHLCAETSLNVPWDQVATAAAFLHRLQRYGPPYLSAVYRAGQCRHAGKFAKVACYDRSGTHYRPYPTDSGIQYGSASTKQRCTVPENGTYPI